MRWAAARLMPQLARFSAASESALPSIAALGSVSASASRHLSPISLMPIVRGFRSSSIANHPLIDILKTEIDYEKQNYTQPEVGHASGILSIQFPPPPVFSLSRLRFSLQELAGGPPSPFTLTETRGDTLMSLSGQFGNETINVDVMVNDQPEEEPFESEEGVLDVDVGVVFTVQVVKGDDSLVFECKSDGSYLTVLHVAVEPADEDVEESAYTGPAFDELDDELQRQFQLYLEERGVGADLGAYLLRLVHDKEQREYMYWLERTAAFVQAP